MQRLRQPQHGLQQRQRSVQTLRGRGSALCLLAGIFDGQLRKTLAVAPLRHQNGYVLVQLFLQKLGKRRRILHGHGQQDALGRGLPLQIILLDQRGKRLGRIIRTAKDVRDEAPRDYFLRETGAYLFMTGKISDVLRETRDGFNFGRTVLEGFGEDKGKTGFVEFQNENLYAQIGDDVVMTVPDIICLVDHDTFTPVPTDALKYGKRVMLIGLPCDDAWRTPAGVALGGPEFFGLSVPYAPVEQTHERFGR